MLCYVYLNTIKKKVNTRAPLPSKNIVQSGVRVDGHAPHTSLSSPTFLGALLGQSEGSAECSTSA